MKTQTSRYTNAIWRGLARGLGAPLERRDRLCRADAIVVLGSKLRSDGRLSRALDERIVAGVELWQRGLAPIFCVTGGGPPGRVEATAMAARAIELGVPKGALRIEALSANTGENARFSARLLGAEGCRRVWVVSQPFHLLRATLLFAKFGLEPLAWSASDSLQHRNPRLALRWLVREYLALAKFAALEAQELLFEGRSHRSSVHAHHNDDDCDNRDGGQGKEPDL